MARSKGPHTPDTMILRFDAKRLRKEGITPVVLGFEKETPITFQDLAVVALQCLLSTARVQIAKVDDKKKKGVAREELYGQLNTAFKNTLDALMPTKRTLTDLAILIAEDEIVEMATELGVSIEKLADMKEKAFRKEFASWKRKKIMARQKGRNESGAGTA